MDHGQRTSKTNYAYNNKSPTQATIACNLPKVNSVFFEDSYYHINPIDTTHEDTHLINIQ